MGIVVNDQGGRSELQERLAAELKEKIAKQQGAGPTPEPDTPDLVKDSAYIEDYKKKYRPNGRVVGIITASAVILVVIGLIIVLGS